MADSQTNDNTTCVVCFKNVLYFSIGECDHPVCFECSTRMRVLCLQNECPICRQGLLKVVFTDSIQPYKELRNKVFSDKFFERQYKIGFSSEEIKNAYETLLENRCKLCENLPPFRTYNMLSDHMRKVHERFFCDLCVKHLKIFTSERKCYTRQELAHHRRKGDPDNTSHRGHPLCEFCEERFMDADELYRHLRKEHLYCHLCDADGKNLYYPSHNELANHFRNDHYLCEEGECQGQHLTAVFRTEIDLKAHKATVHGRGMTRGAARLARTLELQFNITPHPVAQRVPRAGERLEPQPSSPPPAAAAPHIDTRSDEQFPRLSTTAPATNLMLGAPPSRTYRGEDTLTCNDKNFPALDGSAGPSRPFSLRPDAPVASAILKNSKPSVSIQLHSQPASASNFRLTQPSGNRISIPSQRKKPISLNVVKDDHPSIGAATVQPSKVAVISNQEMRSFKNNPSSSQTKKSHLNSEAFPALSSTSAPTAPPQWITVSKPKEKSKTPKSDPPPQPKQPNFNPVADFPILPTNKKSKSKKNTQQPVSTPPTSQTDNTKTTKKEKNKQIKKEYANDFSHTNGINEWNYNISTLNDSEGTKVDAKVKIVESSSTVTVNSEKNNNKGNGDFTLTARDYPPLSSRDNSNNQSASEVSVKKVAKSEVASVKSVPNGTVPPGFRARPPCDGMTFTNSAGQTFSAPVHTYIPPPNFEQRNRNLVKRFTDALGSAEAMEEFKEASKAFRSSLISAEEFYQHCKKGISPDFDSMFLELVALLPDIAKQQELVVGRPAGAELHVCATCGQLLAPEDRSAHEVAHWPPLGSR